MQNRGGFTLIELIIATFVFAIGGLGLAATAGAVSKLISANSLRASAAHISRARAETAHAAGCQGGGSGEARGSGIHSVWSTAGSEVATLSQFLSRSDAFGTHSDRFISAVPCD